MGVSPVKLRETLEWIVDNNAKYQDSELFQTALHDILPKVLEPLEVLLWKPNHDQNSLGGNFYLNLLPEA